MKAYFVGFLVYVFLSFFLSFEKDLLVIIYLFSSSGGKSKGGYHGEDLFTSLAAILLISFQCCAGPHLRLVLAWTCDFG